MELTVNKTGLNTCFAGVTHSDCASISQNTNAYESRNTNLNYDPKAVAFKGLFFKRKPADPYYGEQRIYGGKYKVCTKEIKDNDIEASVNVLLACSCFETRPGSVDDDDPYDTKRLNDNELKTMSATCLALFLYYADGRTSFPQFYDLMARALPKACADRDKHSMNDNASRMYEVLSQQIVEFGNLCDPGTQDPLESGIKYLYFTNDVSAFELRKSDNSTKDMIKNMSCGTRPILSGCGANPRCATSWLRDEIYVYGTPYIIQHYAIDRRDPLRPTNPSGMKTNPNFTVKPPPKQEPYMIEIDPWEYNP